ncbi:hypothetical protein BCR44DRAFT_1495112 [Catenaria anguillulae PL171]|uniref:Uncharacterized protein n=1 Tax=Catenaria anguillulae PL171 TaxID=765915 RepID=A0A1Y2I475_9FUNG|nr:hypothetical protein BCR44DRAFT_1495112 [Catenaria anguillulae PL171]
MSDNGYYGSSAHPEDRHDDRMETDERDRQALQQAADQDRDAQAPRSRSRSRSAERGGDRDRVDRRAADSSRSPVRRDSRDRERETRRPDMSLCLEITLSLPKKANRSAS